jgi:copper chaperone CopZ
MTGTEDFSAGSVDAAKAKVTTFKMEELAGTDCVQQIVGELVKLGGVGSLKADYSNALLEIQYDPAKVTIAKLIDAMIKGQHPGQVTSEKVAAQPKKNPMVYVGGSLVEKVDSETSSSGKQ